MPKSELTLRRAVERDLPEIASIHLTAYSKGHFTSRLPHDVLVRYYGLFLADGAETLLLLENAEESDAEIIIGFAVFGRRIEAKIERFKSENAGLIAKAAFRHPVAAAAKVLRSLWNRTVKKPPITPAEYLLLSIAVSRPGKGTGGRLLEAFVERAREDGAGTAGLYVNADNLGAINAYVTRGFLVRDLYGGQFYMERAL